MEYAYPALFHKDESGGWFVEFRDLPGCFTQGDDIPDALHMARDALYLWLATELSDGRELPEPSAFRKSSAPDDFVAFVSCEIDPENPERGTIGCLHLDMPDQYKDDLETVLQNADRADAVALMRDGQARYLVMRLSDAEDDFETMQTAWKMVQEYRPKFDTH